jgi:hypothetical protein
MSKFAYTFDLAVQWTLLELMFYGAYRMIRGR